MNRPFKRILKPEEYFLDGKKFPQSLRSILALWETSRKLCGRFLLQKKISANFADGFYYKKRSPQTLRKVFIINGGFPKLCGRFLSQKRFVQNFADELNS
jgi:hypothetical protein